MIRDSFEKPRRVSGPKRNTTHGALNLHGHGLIDLGRRACQVALRQAAHRQLKHHLAFIHSQRPWIEQAPTMLLFLAAVLEITLRPTLNAVAEITWLHTCGRSGSFHCVHGACFSFSLNSWILTWFAFFSFKLPILILFS